MGTEADVLRREEDDYERAWDRKFGEAFRAFKVPPDVPLDPALVDKYRDIEVQYPGFLSGERDSKVEYLVDTDRRQGDEAYFERKKPEYLRQLRAIDYLIDTEFPGYRGLPRGKRFNRAEALRIRYKRGAARTRALAPKRTKAPRLKWRTVKQGKEVDSYIPWSNPNYIVFRSEGKWAVGTRDYLGNPYGITRLGVFDTPAGAKAAAEYHVAFGELPPTGGAPRARTPKAPKKKTAEKKSAKKKSALTQSEQNRKLAQALRQVTE